MPTVPLPPSCRLLRPNRLVPFHLEGKPPPYLVAAGLVLEELSGGWLLSAWVACTRLAAAVRPASTLATRLAAVCQGQRNCWVVALC